MFPVSWVVVTVALVAAHVPPAQVLGAPFAFTTPEPCAAVAAAMTRKIGRRYQCVGLRMVTALGPDTARKPGK